MRRDNRGYTLVEVLLATGIGLVLLAAIYAAVNSAQRSTTGIERKVTAQQDARAALDLVAMEISMASYNPNFVTGIWLSPANCFSTSANQQYRGIQAAAANSLTIEMDINENGIITNNNGTDPNETIAYVLDTVNQSVTRSTNCGGAQPFLGSSVAGQKTVRVINTDPAINLPLFRYYDGTATEIPAANLPASIPDIRAIEITLAVETEDVDPSTNQRRRLIYSTTVIPRNHAPSF